MPPYNLQRTSINIVADADKNRLSSSSVTTVLAQFVGNSLLAANNKLIFPRSHAGDGWALFVKVNSGDGNFVYDYNGVSFQF